MSFYYTADSNRFNDNPYFLHNIKGHNDSVCALTDDIQVKFIVCGLDIKRKICMSGSDDLEWHDAL
ncbi:14103_t:CDS:2 [Entrophospora sp. SA101]|nr:14103_t:CDS:2 [Entrophospora sp. SA101]